VTGAACHEVALQGESPHVQENKEIFRRGYELFAARDLDGVERHKPITRISVLPAALPVAEKVAQISRSFSASVLSLTTRAACACRVRGWRPSLIDPGVRDVD
jgi:hypothetical protein